MKPLQKQIDELKERVRRLESDIKPVQDHTWTKIGDLEWSENLGLMNWEEAKKKCEEMGGRLPTRIELIDLYDNHYNECQKLINNDEGNYFWSATSSSSTNAYTVYLNDGYTSNGTKYSYTNYVRCVREVKQNND